MQRRRYWLCLVVWRVLVVNRFTQEGQGLLGSQRRRNDGSLSLRRHCCRWWGRTLLWFCILMGGILVVVLLVDRFTKQGECLFGCRRDGSWNWHGWMDHGLVLHGFSQRQGKSLGIGRSSDGKVRRCRWGSQCGSQ